MLDEREVGGIGVEGLEKIRVFGAFVSLSDEGEKEGNLELDLGNINAVKKAVEFGTAKVSLEFGVGRRFFGEEFFGVIAGFLANLSIISVKAGCSASEGTREGIGDGAKIRRFEVAIVIFKDRT